MDWIRFSRGHRLDPIAGGSPDAIAVLLHDLDQSPATLLAVGARWAATVPTTAFVAVDGLEQFDPPTGARSWHALFDLDPGAAPLALDRIARHLEPLLAQLDASRLVLVGFREGGTVALHLVLRHGWRCAGVLAFSPRLTRPLPRIIRADAKIPKGGGGGRGRPDPPGGGAGGPAQRPTKGLPADAARARAAVVVGPGRGSAPRFAARRATARGPLPGPAGLGGARLP